MADFQAVPTLISLGSQEAEKVWNSESFQQRLAYYEKVTWGIAGNPRSGLPVLLPSDQR